MKVEIKGFEKFKIWKNRNGFVVDDIEKIIQTSLSNVSLMYWCKGTNGPNPLRKKMIYEFSKRIAEKGKFRLVMSVNDWTNRGEVELYANEILRLWRDRNDLRSTDMSKHVGFSHTYYLQIENGKEPNEEFKKNIEAFTKGFVKASFWDDDKKDLE